jgi:hypothetical protein
VCFAASFLLQSRGSEVSTRECSLAVFKYYKYLQRLLVVQSTIDTKLTMMMDQNHPTMQAFGRTLNRDKGGVLV